MRKKRKLLGFGGVDLDFPLWKFDLMSIIISFLAPADVLLLRLGSRALIRIAKRHFVARTFDSAKRTVSVEALGAFRYNCIHVRTVGEFEKFLEFSKFQENARSLHMEYAMSDDDFRRLRLVIKRYRLRVLKLNFLNLRISENFHPVVDTKCLFLSNLVARCKDPAFIRGLKGYLGRSKAVKVNFERCDLKDFECFLPPGTSSVSAFSLCFGTEKRLLRDLSRNERLSVLSFVSGSRLSILIDNLLPLLSKLECFALGCKDFVDSTESFKRMFECVKSNGNLKYLRIAFLLMDRSFMKWLTSNFFRRRTSNCKMIVRVDRVVVLYRNKPWLESTELDEVVRLASEKNVDLQFGKKFFSVLL